MSQTLHLKKITVPVADEGYHHVTTIGQLIPWLHAERDPELTVKHQLDIANHNRKRYLSNEHIATCRHHLVSHSAHDVPPFLASFAGLGSYPYHLYRFIDFDKLHVMDLGVTRILCDMTITSLHRNSSHP